ncbi:MAG TPA: FAD-dependent oxidoreductase [Pirellulales bacterium]|nr:FAD-dependent oxidoreductase [Pirellulales bacterium]
MKTSLCSQFLTLACLFTVHSATAIGADPASFDIVVYGGTCGGVTAAVEAANQGQKVVLIEPGRHLGGLTSGGLGATDIDPSRRSATSATICWCPCAARHRTSPMEAFAWSRRS